MNIEETKVEEAIIDESLKSSNDTDGEEEMDDDGDYEDFNGLISQELAKNGVYYKQPDL
jgi:hypothetical protein